MPIREKYKFKGVVKKQVDDFKVYLKGQNLSENTIRQKSNYAGYFLKWLENEHLQPQSASYNDLLSFIDYCKLEGSSKKLINGKLRSIKHFYEHLKKQNPSIINPAINLKLKGTRQSALSPHIDFETLDNLYHGFKTFSLRDKRNKIILGLLIYQGLTTSELHRLEP